MKVKLFYLTIDLLLASSLGVGLAMAAQAHDQGTQSDRVARSRPVMDLDQIRPRLFPFLTEPMMGPQFQSLGAWSLSVWSPRWLRIVNIRLIPVTMKPANTSHIGW